MTRTTLRTVLLAAMLLFIAVSCFAQVPDSDLVTPTAEQVLRNAGLPPTAENVGKALSHENSGVREAAAQVAGERRMTQFVRKLQQLLSDPSELTRIAAAESLLLMGDSSGVPELQRALDSSTGLVVVRAARILAATGDMTGFDEIAARLKEGKADAGDRIIFVDALPSFDKYEPLRQQVRALLIASALDDPSADVRLIAVQHLGADASSEAEAALARARAKETDPVVRGVLQQIEQRRQAKPRQ